MFHLFLALLLFASAQASERILLFKSDIAVQEDGLLNIQETIKVHATGNQIRRGIVREFPTRYKDRWGNNLQVGFRVDSVQRDGRDEPFKIESASNGKRIFIGKGDRFLHPGNYTFKINYTTNRQIGFFEKHDELYFNITGNGWRLPIDKAVAIIHLPASIDRTRITLEAYTGYQAERGKDYSAYISQSGDLVFETTLPLGIFEGLTVAVTWPKGYTLEPSWWQQVVWFFQDNLSTVILLICFLLMVAYLIAAYIRIRRDNDLGTIIPLFYPPEGMSPAAVRYVDIMKYDETAFASNIVDMAVHGLLTIEHKQKIWNSSYILHKQNSPEPGSMYHSLYEKIFAGKESISTNKSDAKQMGKAYDADQTHVKKQYGDTFTHRLGSILLGGIFFIISWFPFMVLDAEFSSLDTTLLALMFLLFLISFYYFYSYTKRGLDLKNKIEGFRLFLKTTEEDRLKVVGTPPTKTPELYEKYLPYAIALGVEEQWSNQFAPLFTRMQEEGNAYMPLWYSGRRFRSFSPSSFSSSIGSGLSSSISSSGISPGSFSGSGGRGSSGGGGGGGGGGGW